MNTRLEQFLNAENISQSQFADSIGVARASISHIISGRNKPGFDFIERMMKRYPAMNIEWLISGKGKMYHTNPAEEEQDSLFPISEDAAKMHDNSLRTAEQTIRDAETGKTISKIIVYYTDNTFKEVF